jgi:nucleotide-binding universal stress UspA family protein
MTQIIIQTGIFLELYKVNEAKLKTKNMKSLLIATDFSVNARHAAEYGYFLASQLKKNIILCNTFLVPAEAPQSAMIAWPLVEYNALNEESAKELKDLKDALLKNHHEFGFKPVIKWANEPGLLADTLNTFIDEGNIEMTILGTHAHNGLDALIMGNHSRKMIDAAKGLLMLVPSSAKISAIEKIAFATDFSDPEQDLEIIYKLIQTIRPLNAELLVTHITNESWPGTKLRKSLEQFLTEISNKADYPKIYYRIVRSDKAEKGLEWLCDHGQVDVLAMVHRDHGILKEIISGSHTKKMADIINIPLLVIPENFGQ